MVNCQPCPFWKWFVVPAFLVLTADLLSKELIFYFLGPPAGFGRQASVTIIDGFFYLTTSYNTGALWGLGRTWPYAAYLFGLFSIVAAAVICYWVFCRGSGLTRWPAVALGLILGGSLGNGYDRFIHGHVRDFLDVRLVVYDWPIFNLADTALVCGALMLAWYGLFWAEERDPKRPGFQSS